MKTTNPTTAQLTAFGAEKMGWKLAKVTDFPTEKYEDYWYLNGQYVCTVANFAPTTDIAQATDIALKMGFFVTFKPVIDGILLSLYKPETYDSEILFKTMSDCALQIMLTLYNMEVER